MRVSRGNRKGLLIIMLFNVFIWVVDHPARADNGDEQFHRDIAKTARADKSAPTGCKEYFVHHLYGNMHTQAIQGSFYLRVGDKVREVEIRFDTRLVIKRYSHFALWSWQILTR